MDNKDLVNISKNTVTGKGKGKRPNGTLAQYAKFEDPEVSKYMQNSLEIAALPDIDNHNPEQVSSRIKEYFQICIGNGLKPTMAGLALALNMSRNTLWQWVTNQTKDIPKACIDEVVKAHRILNLQMEDAMMSGKINPVSGIFLMKNNMGYQDKQEVVVTPNQGLGAEMTKEELEANYAATMVLDEE